MEAIAWGAPSKTGREPEEGAALSGRVQQKKRKGKTLNKKGRNVSFQCRADPCVRSMLCLRSTALFNMRALCGNPGIHSSLDSLAKKSINLQIKGMDFLLKNCWKKWRDYRPDGMGSLKNEVY
ncbi:hypothetical protein CDAR_228431 [Caerostris darwini]|uniref:Uncharacterized protein n=1 Tax=Caerostris darwini TaxID=1538125 RepID=A0AAV4N4N3_9ARAC|nr:hypothetical protein CDAR_228431 [Caerostris darwini]